MNNEIDNDNDNDNVRPPDESKVDQLLEDTRSDFEKEIDEALYLSLQDMRVKQDLRNFTN